VGTRVESEEQKTITRRESVAADDRKNDQRKRYQDTRNTQ